MPPEQDEYCPYCDSKSCDGNCPESLLDDEFGEQELEVATYEVYYADEDW